MLLCDRRYVQASTSWASRKGLVLAGCTTTAAEPSAYELSGVRTVVRALAVLAVC